MKNRFYVIVTAASLTAVASGLISGCASTKEKEEHVSLAQLSEPARATVNRETAGGQVESIVKEHEHGKWIYDVEANVRGKHMEWTIADTDGAILGTETQIEFSELPEAVRVKAEKFFGTTTGLTVMKGVEDGETTYEIEGKKSGKTKEVSYAPDGKRTE
jgi:uncharacterized membrane protein YkoI